MPRSRERKTGTAKIQEKNTQNTRFKLNVIVIYDQKVGKIRRKTKRFDRASAPIRTLFADW